jgi:hypothetical protein
MKAYRIVNNDYDGEIVFGLVYPFNQTNAEKKLIQLFEKMKPWNHCIPYYKKSHFAFVSKNALLTFLFSNKDIQLNIEDIKELDLAGWKIESFELTTWSNGLSKFMCTYFNDEVVEDTIESYTFDELYNISYSNVIQDNVPKFAINEIKAKYYTDIETHYEY